MIVGAFAGALWEFGLLDRLSRRLFNDEVWWTGGLRDMLEVIAAGTRVPLGRIAAALAVVAVLIAFVRLVSMGWAVVRLYGFRLSRTGDDLRTEYGLLTRVAATIPLHRVQTLTIRQGPLQRLAGRVSVRVETAGGAGPRTAMGTSEREWLAPIVRPAVLAGVVRHVMPELDLRTIAWQQVDPRAFRRVVKRALLLAVVVSVVAARPLGWWSLGVLAGAVVWAVLAAYRYAHHLGWAATDEVVAFRSGWLWRAVTVARTTKIQAVTLVESPLDRRAAMARVRVDTAGASERSHRVSIPYLARSVAQDLHARLARRAAATAFRW